MSRAEAYRNRRVSAAIRGGFSRIGKEGTARQKEALRKGLTKLWTKYIGQKCPFLCGKKLTPRVAQFAHIQALAVGGPHTASNIILLCKGCNKSQHTLSKDEYLAIRKCLIDNFGESTWQRIRRWMAGSKF